MELFEIWGKRDKLAKSINRGIIFFGIMLAAIWFLDEGDIIGDKAGHIFAFTAIFALVFLGMAFLQLVKEVDEMRLVVVRLNLNNKLIQADPTLEFIKQCAELMDSLGEEDLDENGAP